MERNFRAEGFSQSFKQQPHNESWAAASSSGNISASNQFYAASTSSCSSGPGTMPHRNAMYQEAEYDESEDWGHDYNEGRTGAEMGERPFRCYDCGMTFKKEVLLNKHKRIHTGQRPLICPKCGKSFFQRRSLTVHVRTHSDVPFTCEQCGMRFKCNKRLNRHMRTHGVGRPSGKGKLSGVGKPSGAGESSGAG